MAFSFYRRPLLARRSTMKLYALSGRWLRRRTPTRAPASGRRGLRLRLEQLEDRSVPSTFTVLNLNDGGSDSLRAAIAAANANPDADVIRFANGLNGTIALTSQLSITDDVT